MKALTNLLFHSGVSIVLFFLFMRGAQTFAQSTILKLPTTDNTSSFDITQSESTNIFRMFGDGGLYLGGIYNNGVIPIEGSGTRLIWYPRRAAFRVGRVDGTQWDNANIGAYSTAAGYNATASGSYSTAMGRNTIASGNASTALGYETTASSNYSIAMGYKATASGFPSTAMGYETTASGAYSTAIGVGTTANGLVSTAMGLNTIASGNWSTSIGYNATSSGNHSIALGLNVSSNGKTGSFIFGDASTFLDTTLSSATNQMTMRFAGGYRLFTNSTASIGALLDEGANSWTTISDSTKKENFIYADGEQFLSSLSKLRLGSWNYKTQDSKAYRHYGPMAQEIFSYFGKDELGTIGNDTTLATADMDGIIMICLQALEKRTAELKEKQTELQRTNEEIAILKEKLLLTEKKQETTDAKVETLSRLIIKLMKEENDELAVDIRK